MEKMKPFFTAPVVYKDSIFRIVVAVLGTHFLTVYGYDKPVSEIMLKKNYWIALGFGSLMAWGGISIIYRMTVYLDRHYDWYEHTLIRAVLQLLLGWVFPLVCMFLFAAGYFALFGFDIRDSDYMKLDFPVIAILMLLMNAFYICYYFYLRNAQLKTTLANQNSTSSSRELFIVQTALQSIPVKTTDICYVYIQNGIVLLRTFDMPHTQDAYIIPETLKEMESVLDSAMFYRNNRQMIVNFASVQAFRPGKNQTLELDLSPPLVMEEPNGNTSILQRLRIVSEDRVADFKRWMER